MEDIKFIVSTLNQEPFNKNLNLISYDNFRGEQRLEILFQVFKAIDETVNTGILQTTEIEEVVMKILEMLRILKYSPPEMIEPSAFRQALITGDRNITNHILYYLLSKLPELKKRAYLARFLVKIEVSPEVEGDQDVVQLYEDYEKLMQNFKLVHSHHENLRRSLDSVQILQKDIKAMEDEKNQIQEKLVTVKRKVDENHDSELFELVKHYKEEKEKNETLNRQIIQQDSELQVLTKKLEKNKYKLNQTKSWFQLGHSPEEILEKFEEEVQAKIGLVKEILPQEVNSIERYIQDIEEIESQPSMLPEFLDQVKEKVQKLTKEVNEMIEKRMLQADDEDERLMLVRQSAALVSEKRNKLLENLKKAQNDLEGQKNQLDEKKKSFGFDEILQGDELKNYVDKMRDQNNLYKQKRLELAEIRNEGTILTKTEQILKQKQDSLERILVSLEEQRGIVGYFSASETDILEKDLLSENSEDLKTSISDLNEKINQKKVELAPLVKDLRPLRQQVHELQTEHDQKKGRYDSLAADLESDIGRAEVLAKKLRNEVDTQKSFCFTMEMELEVLKAMSEIVEHEMQIFISSDSEEKKKSLETRMTQMLDYEVERKENLRRSLRELDNNKFNDKRQLKIWKDLRELFKIKQKCLEKRKTYLNSEKTIKKDHLIL